MIENQKMSSPKAAFWSPYMNRSTTGKFSHVGQGYQRHCGPTAVTNVLLTLQKKSPVPGLYGLSDIEVFREVADLGRKLFAYYNMSFLKLFGGTSMFLTGLYLRVALWKYGLKKYRVRACLLGTAARQQQNLTEALDRGELVYLQLLRDPKYGSHHLLAEGYEGPYLILTDGWSPVPQKVLLSSLKRISFWSIAEK